MSVYAQIDYVIFQSVWVNMSQLFSFLDKTMNKLPRILIFLFK